MLKKLISLLLALAMVIGMMTMGAVGVFATEEGGENVTEPETTEPEATEPEVTEPEATEPEATEPPAPHEHS